MTVAISIPAVTAAENTSNKRVPAVTGMASPLVIPELVLPRLMIPVRGGARVTAAPGIGVKVLSGAVDRYSWAVSVTSDPTRAAGTPTLAKALIEVIVPSLGMEKATFGKAVVSISPARI